MPRIDEALTSKIHAEMSQMAKLSEKALPSIA
jgi:hypothetical protein